MQESSFTDPASAFHQLGVHDGDLPCRAAKTDEPQLQPEPERLPEADRLGSLEHLVDGLASGRGSVLDLRVHALPSSSKLARSPSKTPLASARSWSSSAIVAPQAGQDLLHPGGLRRLNATDVQEVNDGAEPVHALALQAEGGDQVFERHLCACMGKPCAIEVESQGALWAFRWRSEPQDAGILINVAPNQPGASQSIHPGTCACRPGPPLIVADKQPDDGAVNRMRFVRRARDWRPLPAQASGVCLAPGLPGKKSMSLSWA